MTDLKDLAGRWNTLVQELKDHPRAKLHVADTWPGVDPESVGARLTELGLAADPDVIAFYGWSNGLRLRWTIDDEPVNGGSITILPLEHLGDPERYEGPLDALEEAPLDSYGFDLDMAEGHAIAFDFFNRDPEHVDLAGMLPFEDRVDVFVSEDHIACITDTALLSFGEYIDLLFRGYGAPAARAALQMGFSNEEAKRASELFPGVLEKRIELGALIDLVIAWPNNDVVQQFFR